MLKWVAGGAVGLFIYSLLGIKNAGDKLRSDFVSVDFKGISKGDIRLMLKTEHSNPTGTDLFLDLAFVDVLVDGSKLARIRHDLPGIAEKAAAEAIAKLPANSSASAKAQAADKARTGARAQFRIKANSTTVVPLHVKVPLLSLGLKLGGMLTAYLATGKWELPKLATLNGDLKVNGWNAPVSQQIPLNVAL